MQNANENICISICSYRDPDIYNTIHSLLDNAFNYKNIFVYVYIQELIPYSQKHYYYIKNIYRKNVYIETAYYKNAKGPLYARQFILKNMIDDKEQYKYYFQIDSHMRFIHNWDIMLINNYINLWN